MATQSYRERMKAQRAEASAQRKAEQAERQRQIELRCEVHRLALQMVKAGIQAKGQRKLSTYSRADDRPSGGQSEPKQQYLPVRDHIHMDCIQPALVRPVMGTGKPYAFTGRV